MSDETPEVGGEATPAEPKTEPKRRFGFPDAMVLIFGMVVFMQLLTYVVPKGEYRREVVYRKPDTGEQVDIRARKASELIAAEEEAAAPDGLRDPGEQASTLLEEGELETDVEVVGQHYKVLEVGEKRRLVDDPMWTPEERKKAEEKLETVKHLPPWACLTAVPKGLMETADIIFFVFLIGGTLGVIRATGAIDALLATALRVFGGKPSLLIAGMMTTFALGSATIGMAEEYLPFLPILVLMCRRNGMDAIVAMGIICLGYSVGYGCASINPFTVQVAQNIAGLPQTSGQWYRWLLMVVCLAVGVQHLLAYSRKVARDPAASLVADKEVKISDEDAPKDVALTNVRGFVLLALLLTIGLFVGGVMLEGWYLEELSACFFGLGVVVAFISWMAPSRWVRAFIGGASELTGTALLIGFARAIQVVMNEGLIADTLIRGIIKAIDGLPPQLAAVGMLVVQSITNFLIPSGSGQAYVTMPIMKEIAGPLGVSQQTAVLAYQMGDGFTNIIVPTNAVVMGMLLMAGIPYERWFRFLIGYFLKIYVVAMIALVVAVSIGYE